MVDDITAAAFKDEQVKELNEMKETVCNLREELIQKDIVIQGLKEQQKKLVSITKGVNKATQVKI